MIEQHVTSLELSKKLHEAGLFIEGEYCWAKWPDGKVKVTTISHFADDSDWRKVLDSYFPAYLATELLEVLPREIRIKGRRYELRIKRAKDYKWKWCVRYWGKKNGALGYSAHGGNMPEKELPNALARVLLHLKEHNLLK